MKAKTTGLLMLGTVAMGVIAAMLHKGSKEPDISDVMQKEANEWNWILSLSLDELKKVRYKVWSEFSNAKLPMDYRENRQRLMNAIDDLIRRKQDDGRPVHYAYHREHGFSLYKD